MRFIASLLTAVIAEKLLFKGGTIINEHETKVADVLVDGGKIVRVGENLSDAAAKTVDATGKLIMPGGIDPHTHLEMPFMGQTTCDDYDSGHAAALAGGTTMHIDFALPVDGSLLKGYEAWRVRGQKARMDFGFHMAVTSWNAQVAKEMEILVKEKGVNSFKLFLAYKGALMVTDEQFIEALRQCKKLGALCMVHAENGDAVAVGQKMVYEAGITGPEGHALSRPAILEGEATHRAIALAEFVGTPLYVVHVMSELAAKAVADARERGVRVWGEPTLAGLTLDESRMFDKDYSWAAAHVMSPPIRKRDVDGKALRKLLKNKVLSVVATDHAVFDTKQKLVGRHDFRILPNGVNGLEERIPVLWDQMVRSGELTPQDFVRVTSTEVARIFNVYPRKGVIAEGSDADFYLMDDAKKDNFVSAKTHHSKLDINVFEGFRSAKIDLTVSQGKIAYQDGKVISQPGQGAYVETPAFSPFVFTGLEAENKGKLAEWPAEVPVMRQGDRERAINVEL